MKTIVRNLLNSKETTLFVNDFTPKHNLINHIICERQQTDQILNHEFRSKLENNLNIVEKTSKNGDLIAFCEELNLIARQKN